MDARPPPLRADDASQLGAAGGRHEEVDARNWMEWFVGASEWDLIQSKEKFTSADPGDNRLKKQGPTGETDQSWSMGTFEQPSVAELRRDVQALLEALPCMERQKRDACPLNVIDGTDIGVYQALLRTEDKAMIQIASNFHCLENGNPRTSADCGRLVSGYAMDCTQGPAAAFGVPAASLLRAHFAFKEPGRPSAEWGQSSERQVNLIQDISSWCGSCINGKALLTGSEQVVTPDVLDEVASRIRVGLHSDAEVVFTRGRDFRSMKVVDRPFPLVDQVCSATICYGFVEKDVTVPRSQMTTQLTNLARAMLRAAYEGAYLAAIKRGRELLLLTLIGGASFRNPLEVILQELKRAHEKWSPHPASKLREVKLVLFDKGAEQYQKLLSGESPPAKSCSWQ